MFEVIILPLESQIKKQKPRQCLPMMAADWTHILDTIVILWAFS